MSSAPASAAAGRGADGEQESAGSHDVTVPEVGPLVTTFEQRKELLPSLWVDLGGGVYRCAYPKPEHYGLLKSLGIKTVINLLDQLPDEYKNFISHCGIRYIHSPVKGNKLTPEDMSRTRINACLRALGTAQLGPVLVHCRSGKHRTGALMGCYRVTTGWAVAEACEEYVATAQPKQREVDCAFIAAFRPDLAGLPPTA